MTTSWDTPVSEQRTLDLRNNRLADFIIALLLVLAEGLLEGLLEGFVEVLFDAAASRREQSAPIGIFALLYWGAVTGAGFALLVPGRVFQLHVPFPGLSLVIGPLVAGACMHFAGEWRRQTGHKYTTLATFQGGVVFAFGMALARFLMVGIR